MLFLHMGYGIGSCIVSLYSSPFLAIPMSTAPVNITNASMKAQLNILVQNESRANCDLMQTTEQAKTYLKESRIEYSYGISGCMIALLSVVF